MRTVSGRALTKVSKNHLQKASEFATFSKVPGKRKPERRSGCPVSISLEVLGDRWSLLIVRDLMVRGYRTFKEFQGAGEGIATNVLADRLRRLQESGIIIAEVDEADGRRVNYRLTEKGIDLAPVVLEWLIWGARHEETGAPCDVIAMMEKHRAEVLVEVRRRWRERDSTPILPMFGAGFTGVNLTKRKSRKETG
jgi:DNA-binding HxlR family transcriptional regulator